MVSAELTGNNQIKVQFSEEAEKTSAENINNYQLSANHSGIIVIQSALQDAVDARIVWLSTPTLQTDTFRLQVTGIKDSEGLNMSASEFSFVYSQAPQKGDIVFSEIMSDPTPSHGLPDVEFIEIYNRSDKAFFTESWTLTVGSSEILLPVKRMESNTYVLLLNAKDTSLMSNYHPRWVLSKSMSLPNSKGYLQLKSANTVLDALTYSYKWQDTEKQSGGYSLERIDLNNLCQSAYNWTSSAATIGGTPASENSINAENIDTVGLLLASYQTLSSKHVKLIFNKNIDENNFTYSAQFSFNTANSVLSKTLNQNEVDLYLSQALEKQQELKINLLSDWCGNVLDTILVLRYQSLQVEAFDRTSEQSFVLTFSEAPDETSASNVNNYLLNNQPAVTVYPDPDDYKIYHILYANALESNTQYQLKVQNIMDSEGEYMPDTVLVFYYYVPQTSNLIINEVLYKPQTNASEFIEILNNSDKDINLKEVYLWQYNADGELSKAIPLVDSSLYLPDGQYGILTPDSIGVKDFYTVPTTAMWILNKHLPSLSDSSILVLKNNHEQTIDSIFYTDKWQFSYLISTKGVSLERVNPLLPAYTQGNWQSAAETAGWATPGSQNSQYSAVVADTVSVVSLSSETISPDNDGRDDRLTIYYNLDDDGYQLIARVMDSNGRQVAKIANNKLLGKSGELYWDGLLTDGTTAQPGIYVIYFKFFKADGSIKTDRKVVVIAQKF